MNIWKKIKKEHKARGKAKEVKKDLIIQQEVARKLDNYVADFLNGKIEFFFITPKKPELVGKKIIWQFWYQGIDENTPKLVRTCFNSVQKYRGEYEVIILSKETLTDYIDEFPDFVWKKFGTGGFDFPKIANLVRLYLLSAYGGVWLDATILLTASINEDWLKKDFFALQRTDTPPPDLKMFTKFDPIGLSWSPQSYVRMQNSFMIAKPHHKIIDDLISMHLQYWKNEKEIGHYFFFQIMFNRMMQHEEWKNLNCEIVSYADFHRFLIAEFDRFDKKLYDKITARWNVHKLTLFWTWRKKGIPSGSFADVLINEKELNNHKRRIILMGHLKNTLKVWKEQIALYVKKILIITLKPLKNRQGTGRYIVSLTSYGNRIADLTSYTIFTLINQRVKPDKVILWIGYGDKEKIPKMMRKLIKKGLEIRFCEDIKSYTKIIYALEAFPNDCIITADDDVLYPKNWLERLVAEHKKNPEKIIYTRAHGIKTYENHHPLPYNDWFYCIKPETYLGIDNYSSFSVFPTGVGGILYPPKCFHKDVTNRELFMKLAPRADDIWLWAMAVINEKFGDESPYVAVEKGDKGLRFVNLKSQQKTGSALNHYNVSQKGNDKQIEAVIRHYPQIIKTLKNIKKYP